MKQQQQLGLDELMIVNPGPSAGEALFFLGEDGTLYQVEGIGAGIGLGAADQSGSDPPERYFLGADGVLYELVR
jgi:hypothetical protein